MKLTKKDWIFIAVAVAVLAVFILISGKEKTKRVPYDANHRPYFEILQKTGNKLEAERDCEACHNDRVIPFPKGHPPKNRCLLCHKMIQPRQ